MANMIEKTALETAEKIAAGMGVYVVDVSYKKEGKEWYLRIFIDKEQGVGIDDCESFSRAFEQEFDKLDPIESRYSLEVSSPGVERKLEKDREFLYYIGREVDVKLYKAVEDGELAGMKEFCGELCGYENKTAVIKIGEEASISVPVKEAVYIRLHFEW